MTTRRRENDLDELIAGIVVDCNDEDEELMGFENAFDEQADLPCPGQVVGEDVRVRSVARHDGRRELVATCERQGRSYEVALLDVELEADETTTRLVATYRQWAAHR